MNKRKIALSFLLLGTLLTGSVVAQERDGSAIEDARRAKTEIEALEEATLKILQDLDKEIADWAPGDLGAETRSIKHFKQLIPNLKRRGQKILDLDSEFSEAFDRYQKGLSKAQGAFDAAAEQFQKYAADEDDEFFRQEYAELAEQAKGIGDAYSKRGTQLNGLYDDVDKKRGFVQRSLVFLDRLERFFEIYPDNEAGEKIAEYMERLNRYIGDFEQAIRSFKKFSDKVKEYGDDGPAVPKPGKSVTGLDEVAGQPSPQPTLARSEGAGPSVIPINSRVFKDWTDNTSRHHTLARLIEIRDDRVVLERRDGTIVETPIARLSSDDQSVVRRVGRVAVLARR